LGWRFMARTLAVLSERSRSAAEEFS
jgi:hypothetical protein